MIVVCCNLAFGIGCGGKLKLKVGLGPKQLHITHFHVKEYRMGHMVASAPCHTSNPHTLRLAQAHHPKVGGCIHASTALPEHKVSLPPSLLPSPLLHPPPHPALLICA